MTFPQRAVKADVETKFVSVEMLAVNKGKEEVTKKLVALLMAPPPLNTEAIKGCIAQGAPTSGFNVILKKLEKEEGFCMVPLKILLEHMNNVEGVKCLLENGAQINAYERAITTMCQERGIGETVTKANAIELLQQCINYDKEHSPEPEETPASEPSAPAAAPAPDPAARPQPPADQTGEGIPDYDPPPESRQRPIELNLPGDSMYD
jgi:hypothetical protein